MAAKQTRTDDDLINELTAQILGAKPNTPSSSGRTFGQIVAGFVGDRVADTGDSLAEITAGFSAAGRNYVVAKQTAEARQARRTAERLLAYQRTLKQ